MKKRSILLTALLLILTLAMAVTANAAQKCYAAKETVNAHQEKDSSSTVLREFKGGEEILIEADTVVCALGFRAPYDLTDKLCETCDESYIIGDCNNVGKIYQAVSGGYYTASRI